MNYVKLKKRFDICKPVEGSMEYVKYGLGEGKNFQGIKYTDFTVSDYILREFLKIVPKEVRHLFKASLMTINRDILPHTDSNTNTAINVYLESGGYVTSFCTPAEDAKPMKLPTQTNGVMYNFEDVTIYDSFFALPGEIYILDVTKVHCVHSGRRTGKRVALNMATEMPFDEVISCVGDHV